MPITSPDVDEAVESGCSELKRLRNVCAVANHKGCSAKSMHSFRQIMEILTVPIPFQSFINRLTKLAFFEWLADAQTAFGRMMVPCLLI